VCRFACMMEVLEFEEKPKSLISAMPSPALRYDHTVGGNEPKGEPFSGGGRLGKSLILNRQYWHEGFCGRIDGSGMAGWLRDRIRCRGALIDLGATGKGQVGFAEEVAWRLGWIDDEPLGRLANTQKAVRTYLTTLLSDGMIPC